MSADVLRRFDYKNYEIGGKKFQLEYADALVRLNDKEIRYADVTALRYGIFPPQGKRAWTFWLELLSHARERMKIEFHCGRLSQAKLDERMALWQGIMQVTKERILLPLVRSAFDQVRDGGAYEAGNIEATREGAQLRHRRWLVLKHSAFVPWADAVKRQDDFWLTLSSRTDPAARGSCSIGAWNSPVLRCLVEHLCPSS